MYAERKAWPLEDVVVQIEHVEGGGVYSMSRNIQLIGDLDEEARARLLEIANKCPIHKLLSGKIEIQTALVDAS
jgi:putative redox protein